MAITYSQSGRPISVKAANFGADDLLLTKVTTREAISEAFETTLELLALTETVVDFDKVLGQAMVVKLQEPGKTARYLHGIVKRFTLLGRMSGPDGPNTFFSYKAEVCPSWWFLTQTKQSRIFQQLNVVDILKKILVGFDVAWNGITGTYQPRDYCVQYRESDFDFASRLMEEEGIYYFFKHTETGHQMVLGDKPTAHPDGPTNPVIFNENLSDEEAQNDLIFQWTVNQEIRPGKVTLNEYHFQKSDAIQTATKPILPTITVGTVDHKLNLINSNLEIYDNPGRYAQRFDGTAPGGGDQAAELGKISDDGDRTVAIRIEEQAAQAILIQGASDCRAFSAGHKFKLEKHFKSNGNYVLTMVEHSSALEDAYTTTGGGGTSFYQNSFQCIPAALPYRPARTTAKTRVDGPQTAVVVGPSGQEIFTDKYGRVKVQFPWDRDGKKDANSSCWIRVSTPWASKQWGVVHIPRIGMEVVVAFEEGDPDQPLIVGCVYNSTNMPPYTLPDNMTQSGVKSRSTLQGTEEMFNELRFEDKKDAEDIYFHGQLDFHRVVERDDDLKVGRHQTRFIQNNRTSTLKEGNDTFTIEKGNREETLKEGNETLTMVKGNRSETLKEGNDSLILEKGNRTENLKEGNDSLVLDKGNRAIQLKSGDDSLKIDGGNRVAEISTDDTLTVKGKQTITVTDNITMESSSGAISIKAGAKTVTVEAATSIELKVGGNTIKIEASGITIKGTMIAIEGQAKADLKSPMTSVNGDGMCKVAGGVVMLG